MNNNTNEQQQQQQQQQQQNDELRLIEQEWRDGKKDAEWKCWEDNAQLAWIDGEWNPPEYGKSS